MAAIAAAVAAVIPPEASSTARPCGATHRLGQLGDREVVEQDEIGAERQRLLELLERVDLDLDLGDVARRGARPLDRRADAAGEGDVVVLDQDRVVEAEAVVGAAADAHRVLLEGAQARRRLAGAGDARAVRRDRPRQVAGRGGDAAQAAEQVERHALAGEERAGRPSTRASTAPASTSAPSSCAISASSAGSSSRKVSSATRRPAMRPAGRATICARARAVRRDDGVGGEVAGAAEVLEQGPAQQVFVEQASGWRSGRACRAAAVFLPRRGTICRSAASLLPRASSTRGRPPPRRAGARLARPAPADRQVAAQRLVARRIVGARVAAAALAPRERRGGHQAAGLDQVARSPGARRARARCRSRSSSAAEAGGGAHHARPAPTSTGAARRRGSAGESSLQAPVMRTRLPTARAIGAGLARRRRGADAVRSVVRRHAAEDQGFEQRVAPAGWLRGRRSRPPRRRPTGRAARCGRARPP